MTTTVTGPTEGSLNFAVAHGLGVVPESVTITMIGPGMIYLNSAIEADNVNVYLVATDYGLSCQLSAYPPGASPALGGGYCAITDVVADYPAFQRSAPGSVTDSQIQNWINRGASLIRAALMQRDIDPGDASSAGIWPANAPLLPNGLPLSINQQLWLAELNEDYAASKLGAVLESNVTLQPGEISIAGQRRRHFEAVLKEIRDGKHDAYFGAASRIKGIGGAEIRRPIFRIEQKF